MSVEEFISFKTRVVDLYNIEEGKEYPILEDFKLYKTSSTKSMMQYLCVKAILVDIRTTLVNENHIENMYIFKNKKDHLILRYFEKDYMENWLVKEAY
jgi:hypothetical protein